MTALNCGLFQSNLSIIDVALRIMSAPVGGKHYFGSVSFYFISNNQHPNLGL